MSVPQRDPTFEPFYSSFEGDDDFANRFELSPGERIGSPSVGTSDALAWSVSLIIILCASWILTHDPARWASALADLPARASVALAANQNKPPTSAQNIASAATPPAPQAAQPAVSRPTPILSSRSAPPAPPAPETKPASPVVETPPVSAPRDTEAAPKDKSAAKDDVETASLPSSEHSNDADASGRPPSKGKHRDDAMSDYAPARLEVPEPHDRYQRRAESVGLHPGISRAVLARFSPMDFRNARTAIDTAVAKTPDNGTFIWPQQREPGRALFKVHFVAGAPPDCRRYVVTVTMAGWTTTALPMEKCGVRRRIAAKR
ncbi:hypothetical protein [Hyphomicrobium sp.]|jgi:hypothetical protein|uniref:hypothetical protein n=1 Tax=Hyphomicrobium sp. TaxID=82 RepID=UPI002CCB1058|nr:hypothetical protein [Hyphomicrobium sp.]HVZ03805.1 hypothetical protein [Hyphomicrobium sp.]